LEKLSVFDLLRSIFGIIESLEMRFLKSCDYDFANFIVWNKLMNKET